MNDRYMPPEKMNLDEARKRGKANRIKGHSFERKIAIELREIYPEAKRGYQARGGTSAAPDVDGTPFFIECKKGKRTNIKAAWKQALDNTDGRPPIAITKDDNQVTMVTMSLVTFKLLTKASE